VIRRIHVAMRLAAPEDVRDKVERVHEMYAMYCPLSHPAQSHPTHISLYSSPVPNRVSSRAKTKQ